MTNMDALSIPAGGGLALPSSLLAYLHGFAGNLVSAGVRLIPLGQSDGQRIVAALEPAVADTAAGALVAPLEDLGGAAVLAATFSPELADITLYVIDVSAGDKIPRKGGPGITRSDLLVINKIDLAPLVGASLEVMERDARKMRGERPFVFAKVKAGQGVAEVAAFIEKLGRLGRGAARATA